jgi:hypothetical protein
VFFDQVDVDQDQIAAATSFGGFRTSVEDEWVIDAIVGARYSCRE